ncbi:hypothetical protein WJX75_009577 [Coccomyxa subellipsoidea]|uniref:DNA repair metallo-beta-lactamase domain-containing protein n=1 Tax=Coccomyxa subellipsoidea TaxID=248742 RepID=A0ABR2Z5C4_9CHLO
MSRHQVTVQYVAKLNRECPTIAILPSAGGSRGQVTAQEVDAASQLIFKVPYSLHSSFQELRYTKSARALGTGLGCCERRRARCSREWI